MNPVKQWINKIKSGRSSIDELSLFLVTLAFFTSIGLMLLRLNQYIFTTWFFILLAYWRAFSKNKAKRTKENEKFLQLFYPIKSIVINTYRKIIKTDNYTYFDCEKCTQRLRIPKKTGNIRVTCPKCSHSFIKKTLRGKFKSITEKFTTN